VYDCRLDLATDDQDLVNSARTGDLDAYDELVRRHQSVAHRVALVIAGPADAADAVQEGFVKGYRALGHFRDGSPFRPWILTIVANEARNRRRSAGRRDALVLRLAEPTAGTAPSSEDVALAALARERLLAAVQALPERDRQVVTCRYLLDLSEAETAAVLSWPTGTVKSRLSRALDRLREAYRD
jgi:RNA polymerase sigma factor (sigma-70 family)